MAVAGGAKCVRAVSHDNANDVTGTVERPAMLGRT